MDRPRQGARDSVENFDKAQAAMAAKEEAAKAPQDPTKPPRPSSTERVVSNAMRLAPRHCPAPSQPPVGVARA
jgi:hypothetical protein